MDSHSHCRVAVIKMSLRWCLNAQNKHAGMGNTGCLRFPKYDQVSQFFLSAQWAESWGMVLLWMFCIFLLFMSRTLWPCCASARQHPAFCTAVNALQTVQWIPLHVHRSKFWIIWNKVHEEGVLYVQQENVDIYYHLFLCAYKHKLEESSLKLV